MALGARIAQAAKGAAMLDFAEGPSRIGDFGPDRCCGPGHGDAEDTQGRWTPYRPHGRHVGKI